MLAKKTKKLGKIAGRGGPRGGGRPRKPPELKGVTTSLVLPRELLAWLDAEAARRGCSRSAVATDVLSRAQRNRTIAGERTRRSAVATDVLSRAQRNKLEVH